MSRPVDWYPLADSDPIGGDLEAVRTEASYYSNLATEISDQVARLRKIAGQDEMLGKTADKLRHAAGDTADKLAKTHGRVDAVGSALTGWVPHLDTAQTDTLSALHDAQAAVETQKRNAPPPAGTPAPKTDADKQAAADRQRRHDAASADLATAQRKFHDAIDARDSAARKAASTIKDALHDGLKDGFWDWISKEIHDHIKGIKMFLEVLSWVATAVAIACIFIPGLNLLAIGLTVALLAGHTLLAATGNGSWLDVAIDAFALLTFGAGRVLGKAAETARTATLARGGELAATQASDVVNASRSALKLEIEAASQGLGKFGSLKNFANFLNVKSGLFDLVTAGKAGWAAGGAKASVLLRDLPKVSALESGEALGKDIAQNMKDLKALKALFGTDADFAAKLARWNTFNQLNRVSVGAGASVDLTNHGITRSDLFPGLLPGVPAWEKFKEEHSTGWFQP